MQPVSSPAPAAHETIGLDAHPRHIPSNSFDDHSSQSSSASHPRPTPLKLSTDDVSQSAFAPQPTDDLTPPSSTVSETRDPLQAITSTPPDRKKPASPTLNGQAEHGSRSQHGSQSPPLTGTKRTATGQVKPSVHDIANQNNGTRHSHTPSMLSNSSVGNVMEISQQLRTKLTYAMVKVQNGWQTRSLDEVESLASASPRSTVSGFPHAFERGSLLSPRLAMSSKIHRRTSDSESSDSATSDARGSSLNAPHYGAPLGTGSRGLAPPANIVPGSRRRPTPNDVVAFPGLGGAQVHVEQMHTARPGPSQRTPSQNAAMEADAVETLLFMASPSNSGYRPSSQLSQDPSVRSMQLFSSQTSPLRTQFGQTSVTSPKKVAFTDHAVTDGPLDKAGLIDQMLDDITDESDDELEAALRLADKGLTTKLTA